MVAGTDGVAEGFSNVIPQSHSLTERPPQPTTSGEQQGQCSRQWGLPHASGFTVGHVMVLPQHTQHALLPMPAAELVTNDRVPVKAGLDVGPLQALASSADDGHLVYDGRLTGLVLAGLAPCCNSRKHMNGLPNERPMKPATFKHIGFSTLIFSKLGVDFTLCCELEGLCKKECLLLALHDTRIKRGTAGNLHVILSTVE